MSEFAVAVVECPRKHLAGLKARTSMARAHTDCPALWQAFGPRLGQLSPEGCRGSYGASIMLNDEDFDYWATIEFDSSAVTPAGLESLEVAAGPYAKVTVPSLERVSEAYTFIYTQWLKSQTAYIYDMKGPCLEFYPPNWQMTDALEIFMPLSKA